jgi:hypothetical protein
MAVTVLVTGGTLAGGTSASASSVASSVAEGTALAQITACREVVASSIIIYRSSTGTTTYGRFYYGDVFIHHGLVNSRWKTWWPPGVPESEGRTAYAQYSGSRSITCPW